ncbi:fibronectin type III domain-containing protein [Thermodesulfobacteriota bacterium]
MFSACRNLTVITVLLVVALMPGCGRKTPLVPPQKLVPVAINDLRYSLDENGVSLQWSYPVRMENGDVLTSIESFEVLRAEILHDEYCEGCPVRFDKQVLIEGGPLPATGESRKATYRDAGLRDGYRYLYKVRSRGDWWFPSNDSNIVSFLWSSPPKNPEGLQAATGDKTVMLSWEPVKMNIAGNILQQDPAYQVYRKSGNGGFAAIGKPVQDMKFTDTGLINDVEYTYRVRALVTNGDTLQAGGFSQETSGIPRDFKPPPQPENLVTVETPVGIKLIWQAVTDDDLDGYRIYRREESSSEPELIAEVGPGQNHFIDQDTIEGRKWFYTVTSFDAMLPPNESLPSAESVIDLQ